VTTLDAALPEEHEAEIIELPVGVRRFHDSQVRKVAGWLDDSPILSRILEWQEDARRSPAGRHEPFPLRTTLVVMLLAAVSNQPQLASQYTEILYLQISDTMRRELGVAESVARYQEGSVGNKTRAEKALYRQVLRSVHRLLDLMDPSPLPKGRRRTTEAFEAAVAHRRDVLSNEDLALRYDRLNWFVNELIEASLRLLPRSVRRRWKGSVAVDATPIPSFARPSRPKRGERWSRDSRIEIFSADPDAHLYRRTPKVGDPEEDGVVAAGKSIWAMEATLVVAAPEPGQGDEDFPRFVVGMPSLHKPSREPGLNAVRALQSIRDRGYPAGWLAGDRAYTDARPENFALRVKALGYEVVFDYAEDHLGVTDNWQGFLFVEGWWYCPAIPPVLIDATKDFRAARIDESTYRARIVERARYRALVKSKADGEGVIRQRCPASKPHPMASCSNKPHSQRQDGRVMVTIRTSADLRADPPPCCSQETLTLPPEPAVKLRQALLFGSPEWESTYHTLRNTIEGMNGFLKDHSREAIDVPGRRRIFGVAAQSVFVALMVFAGNRRKISEFMRRERGQDGRPGRRTRRRTMSPIQAWLPEPTRVPHGLEPPTRTA
jgi:hypothetical protein